MISVEINNNRIMDVFQDKDTKSIKVITGKQDAVDGNLNIPENDIMCEFVNPNGEYTEQLTK